MLFSGLFNRVNRFKQWLLLAALGQYLWCLPYAHGQLTVEVVGSSSYQQSIAVNEFLGDDGRLGALISQTIRNDLKNSSAFTLIEPPNNSLGINDVVNFSLWKGLGADSLIVGSIATKPDGLFETRFRLFDVVRQKDYGGLAITTTPGRANRVAHEIADFIYKKLTGDDGIFSTRIAYIIEGEDRYTLQIADWDGQNSKVALVSPHAIISPTWSKSGHAVAYVSFETDKPVIYSQVLANADRQILANQRGSNSSPAFSPDDRHLAQVMTLDGTSQIYINNLATKKIRKLTRRGSINTEPVWSPDGNWIYFTSNRSGGPQIYKIPVSGGSAQRVTFTGTYNVSPDISPNGRKLVYISRQSNGFNTVILDLDSREEKVISRSGHDEHPTFAPNGRMVLLASRNDTSRGILKMVSIDGRGEQRLFTPLGSVYEPTWGPYLAPLN